VPRRKKPPRPPLIDDDDDLPLDDDLDDEDYLDDDEDYLDDDDEDLEEEEEDILGVPAWEPPVSSPEGRRRLERLLRLGSDAEQSAQVLSALSGPALLLWRLFAEIGRLIPLEFAAEEARRLLSAEPAEQAFDELQARELILAEPRSATHYVGLPREPAQPLLPHLPPLFEGQPGPGGPPGPLPAALLRAPGELALLGAALWTVRPRCTQAGELYKRDKERLVALLGSGFPLKERLKQLRDLGLCSAGEAQTVTPRGAAQLRTLSYADLVRQAALDRFHGARRHLLQLLYTAQAAGPERSWLPEAEILRAVRIGHLRGPYGYLRHESLERAAASDVADLLRCEALQVARRGPELWVRLRPDLHLAEAAPAPLPPVTVHVQPSFEILVPAEAPPATLLDLGRVAELRKADQLVILQITRTSIGRAVESGLSGEAILDLLRQHARAGVPQNVEAQVRSWLGQVGQARFVEGMVLLLSPDAERLAQHDAPLRQLLKKPVGPGAYLVSPSTRGAIERRLKALELAPAEEVVRLEPAHDERADAAQARCQPLPPLPAAPPGPLSQRTASARAARPDGRPVQLRIRQPRAAPGARPGGHDPVPAGTAFQKLDPHALELWLRRAIQGGGPVFIWLRSETGPWSVVPKRLLHRDRPYLEAFRPATQEYRIIPLDQIQQVAGRSS
jgi:hypothetical protein